MEFLSNLFKRLFENNGFGGNDEKRSETEKNNEYRHSKAKWEKQFFNKRIRQRFPAVILGVIVLVACEKKDDKDAIKDYCMQYVSKYEVIQEKPDGKFEISVLAPDFEQVIETILTEDKEIEITSIVLEEAVEKYPDCEKEYIFYSDSDQMENIEKAFLEEVSHELVVSAIKKVEYKEKWDVEE